MTTTAENTDKDHIRLFAALCAAYGLRKVVISPGSRSAPLIMAFHHQSGIECFVVPDERSAAYFAIGIAQFTQEPVGVICTSGTAALNYLPAIAEAYHQKLPVVAITADRPPEWVGQLDGQTIDQVGIYCNFVSFEAQLPVEGNSKVDTWHLERLVRDGFLQLRRRSLPVHFNVPLREPLYNKTSQTILPVQPAFIGNVLPQEGIDQELLNKVTQYNRILIIIGMRRPSREFFQIIEKIAALQKVVILRENLSNAPSENTFFTSDALLVSIQTASSWSLKPDLIISFGEMLLSKPLKVWVRSLENVEHWVVHEDQATPDVFQRVGRIVPQSPESFIKELSKILSHLGSSYFREWERAYQKLYSVQVDYWDKIPWSDMKVFKILSENIPGNSYVHLGNSSPVRYAQFFPWKDNIHFFGNRGTAGIDGCTSSAIGMASQTDEIVTMITGDVSFIYDTNALWNNYKKFNFKIIVINNKGGNIFSLIPGPDNTGLLDEYFLTHIPVSLELLCKAYSVTYLQATNDIELKSSLEALYANKECSLLEIHTDLTVNTNIWKNYFRTIKTNMTYEQ